MIIIIIIVVVNIIITPVLPRSCIGPGPALVSS